MAYIAQRDVKTIKPHKCFGCGWEYPAGTGMSITVDRDRGKLYSVYWCAVCAEVMSRTFEPGDECCSGDVYAGDPEYWKAVERELKAQQGREG